MSLDRFPYIAKTTGASNYWSSTISARLEYFVDVHPTSGPLRTDSRFSPRARPPPNPPGRGSAAAAWCPVRPCRAQNLSGDWATPAELRLDSIDCAYREGLQLPFVVPREHPVTSAEVIPANRATLFTWLLRWGRIGLPRTNTFVFVVLLNGH